MNIFNPLSWFMVIILMTSCGSNGDDDSDRDNTAEASYRVTFDTNWSNALFPTNFPGNAHFSGLVGATHNQQIRFWETGQLASNGIESMAETGSKSALLIEVGAAKSNGVAEFTLSGQGNDANDTMSVEFDINQNFSQVTLVSMIAPSPDWFVGIHNLDLFEANAAKWAQTLTIELRAYDAGTDDGVTFTSANADSQPPAVISLLTSNQADTDFQNGVGPAGQFIGSMTFTRIK